MFLLTLGNRRQRVLDIRISPLLYLNRWSSSLLSAQSPQKQHLTLHACGAEALASEENCMVVMFGMIGVTFLLHKGPAAHVLKAPGRVASLDEADWLKVEKERNLPGKPGLRTLLTRQKLENLHGPLIFVWWHGTNNLCESRALQLFSLLILGLPLCQQLLLFVDVHATSLRWWWEGVWLGQMASGSWRDVDVKYLYYQS